MVSVLLSRNLFNDLGWQAGLELAQEFQQYKSGLVSFGGLFGRDKPFSWPAEVVEQELWHVHLEEDAVLDTWDYLTENYEKLGFTQNNYTSNKILVYGHAWDIRYSPYILVAILDPEGHAKMDDKNVMKDLAAQYVEEKADYSADPDGNLLLLR
jgi:hypothetical protein